MTTGSVIIMLVLSGVLSWPFRHSLIMCLLIGISVGFSCGVLLP